MDLEAAFENAGNELGHCSVKARFFPYRELKHTWKTTCGVTEFKVSDYLDDAPQDVLNSLAWYLICRANGIRCPSDAEKKYLSYSRSTDLWERKRARYFSRAVNLIPCGRGEFRDLTSTFSYVNSVYFQGEIRNPTLAWVDESPKTRLGFYFAPLRLLAVNSVLDSDRVPRYVLEFVVYHELLHGVLEPPDGLPRRVHHTKSFRDEERKFTMYAEAEAWLRRLAQKKENGNVPQA